MPGFPVLHYLSEFAKLMSIDSVMPSNYFILCCPLLLPSIFASIRVISNESALHIRWPKFGASASVLFNEYSRLISFRTDWLDLLVVKELLSQQHSSKSSLLQHSGFFMVQLPHPYMTTGKPIDLTI